MNAPGRCSKSSNPEKTQTHTTHFTVNESSVEVFGEHGHVQRQVCPLNHWIRSKQKTVTQTKVAEQPTANNPTTSLSGVPSATAVSLPPPPLASHRSLQPETNEIPFHLLSARTKNRREPLCLCWDVRCDFTGTISSLRPGKPRASSTGNLSDGVTLWKIASRIYSTGNATFHEIHYGLSAWSADLKPWTKNRRHSTVHFAKSQAQCRTGHCGDPGIPVEAPG